MIKESAFTALGIAAIVSVLAWMGHRDHMDELMPQCPPPLHQQELIGSGHTETDGASVIRCVYATAPAYSRLMAQR